MVVDIHIGVVGARSILQRVLNELERGQAHAIERHPLGRLGTAQDVADVVAFLCSHDARFITGQSINVSAGFVI